MLQITVQMPNFWKRLYEFKTNAGSLATLAYTKSYGECAIGKTQRNEWKFSKLGFWKTYLVSKSDKNPAQDFKVRCRHTYRMTLTPTPNETFKFEKKGWWKITWSWKLNDKVFMEFKSNGYSRKNRGTVTIYQDKHPMNEWLLLLGWYLIMRSEAAAAATVAAAS